MPEVVPFPFKSLPHLTADEVQLRKKILNAYSFLESRQDLINQIFTPLKDTLKTSVQARVRHLKSVSFEEFQASLSGEVVMGSFLLEPMGQKALVLFEPSLAKVVVSKVLSGDAFNLDKLLGSEYRPVSVLEEGVVQYLLVSLVAHIQQHLKPQNFSVSYDNLYRDPKVLPSLFSAKETLVVFSIQLFFFDREFYLKFVLPLPQLEQMGLTELEELFVQKRLQQFGKFALDMQLEVAKVELEPSDIEGLNAGDILLFDESHVTYHDRNLQGHGVLRLSGAGMDEGYQADLEIQGDKVSAKLTSVV